MYPITLSFTVHYLISSPAQAIFSLCVLPTGIFLQFFNVKEFIFKIKMDKQVVEKCVFSSQERLLQNVRKMHQLLIYHLQ